MFFNWKESYSVKIKSIDNQHKKLIEIINELHESMKSRKSHDKIEKILLNLKQYTTSHFSTEEKYFKEFNYPNIDEHLAEHDLFVKKIEDFIKDYKSGKMMLSLKLMNFLKEWLRDHIAGRDQKYSSFLTQKGVK